MAELLAERMVVRILSAPLDEPVPMSFSRLTTRRTCLLEVHAGGEVGVGESWINYPEWAATERVATLLEGVAPVLLGTDVCDPGRTQRSLLSALGGVARQWGAPGPVWQAISAVDLALWDLRGRLDGVPTAHLLGPRRQPAPVYASGVGPTRVAELCRAAVERGITAVKAKVGFGDETDRATLRTITETAPGLRVFADANCAWSFEEARRQTELLASEGVEWLEEPLARATPGALAELHQRTRMPLAAGENVYGLADLEELAEVEGVTQLQPDPAKSGGISVARALTRGLAGRGCRLSPHWYAGGIGLRAALALVTSLPGTGWLELDIRPNPLREELLGEGFVLDDHGAMLPATGPGLVSDLDHDRVSSLQIAVAERSAR